MTVGSLFPLDPKSLLARHGLTPKRSFGQNFLADEQLARRIAELAVPEPRGAVVEIGAGLGALTRPLLERAEKVLAIERDRDLCRALRQDLSCDGARFQLLEADAKRVDLAPFLATAPRPRAITGNLPYQITGPLLKMACGAADKVERVAVLVQREVADRVTASPGTSQYGALSVFLQARFEAKRPLVIRKGAFYPQPSVDSAVVVLVPRATALDEETPEFQQLVLRAFAQRRKKLRNAWRGVLGIDSDRLAEAACRANIDLDQRGESLSPVDFARMKAEVTR